MNQAQRIFELSRMQNPLISSGAGKNIFSFASGKGGTGKTFLALNTSIALSAMKKKVLLIDMDFNFSNIHILLNHNPDLTYMKYFRGDALLNQLIFNYSENLDIIFGDSGKRDYPKLNEMKIKSMFAQINRISVDYDYVIIDCASGGSEENLEIMKNSGNVFVVITPEPTSIMDGYVLVKLINSYSNEINKIAVVNKSTDAEEGKTAYENFNKAAEHFLKETVESGGVIEASKEVSESIISQIPFIVKNPNHKITYQIYQLSTRIQKIAQLANNNH